MYGNMSLDPVGAPRVTPVVPIAPSVRVGTRMHGGATSSGGTVETPEKVAPAPLPPLAPTSLRAQAVTGLLEARRADLVTADRQLAVPGAAVQRSLADVWPPQEPDRPDARAAARSKLPEEDTEAARRKQSRARQVADQQAELIAASAAAEVTQAQENAAASRRGRADERARGMADSERIRGVEERPSPRVEDDRRVPTEEDRDRARAALTRAADDAQRLREAVDELRATARHQVERTVAEAGEIAAQVGVLNGRIAASVDSGAALPEDLLRRREQLVVSLARSIGATALPGEKESLDVMIEGRALVTGESAGRLSVVDAAHGETGVALADGRSLALSSGVLATRLSTLNRMLPSLAQGVDAVLDRLGAQAVNPGGEPVDGGPHAAAILGGLLRELSRAAESSAAYAQVAAGVEDLVSRLTIGDLPASARRSDLLLGAVTAAEVAAPRPMAADTLSPFLHALSSLGATAHLLTEPGAALPTRTVISGAPGIATPTVADDAPDGSVTLRVLSLASGGVVASAQSFHPDSPLGDGRERTLEIVTGVGSPQERSTVLDIGRYPTPTDLASLINQANVGVRASLSQLTGGTVQLRLESLTTGRGENITILNGLQPPSASSVLGRVMTLNVARDTMVEVQREGKVTTVLQDSGHRLEGILPGVDVDLHRADPSRSFAIGVTVHSAHAVDATATLVAKAGDAVSAAVAAGATGTAASVMAALGLAEGAPEIGTEAGSEGQPTGGATRRGIPGLSADHQGRPALDRDELTSAYETDAGGTSHAVAAVARAVSVVTMDTDSATWEAYAAARAAQGPDPLGTYAPADARRAGREDQTTIDLTRQERALMAVLAKLQDQGVWLGNQLAT